jgi:ppGpp synthetase/RelA/SpoT-type nucleotidyltranferase
MDIKQIADSWKEDEPKYKELGGLVSSFLKSTITECEILPEISYRTKELLSIVKKIKKKLREKDYSYSHLNDKLGIRIICTFQGEMDIIDAYLHKYFEIKKVEKKKETLDVKTLDYISNHYDVCIKLSVKQFSKQSHLKDLVFEIQVRTLNQHAWANTAHSLSYKQEAEIPPYLMRKVYRLLSLYEIADDEFSAVNKALIEQPDNRVYTLLRKLESKIYKYAQVDYDRESSLFAIRTILGYLTEEQIQTSSKELENFIKKNETRIQRIFDENRSRYFEIPSLTQPEIFLIWFCLDKFPYSITDNWADDFDSFEIEQITTLWGKQID